MPPFLDRRQCLILGSAAALGGVARLVSHDADFIATTVAPTQHPEQEILDHRFETDGCEARLQNLSDEAAQLVVSAGRVADGQTIRGQAIFKLRVSKSYFGFRPDQFPAKQTLPRQISQAYLSDSPGIETKIAALDKIIAETTKASDHPWDKAIAFHQWVSDNIRGVPGDYTSVKRALETRTGDCEERAGVFIALCRAYKIPARLVWVPNHAWAEFMLIDESDRPHWIAAPALARNKKMAAGPWLVLGRTTNFCDPKHLFLFIEGTWSLSENPNAPHPALSPEAGERERF